MNAKIIDLRPLLPPFPATPGQMESPANVETLGALYMRMVASLAQEIMIRGAKEVSAQCGLKPDDLIETIKADCEHMIEQCEYALRWQADLMRGEM